MLEASKKEFSDSFKKYYSFYCIMKGKSNAYNNLRQMILIYCVECGLKYRLMEQNRVNSYKQLNEIKEYGHDIKKMLKDLKVFTTVNFNIIKTKNGDYVDVCRYQEMFRYNIKYDGAYASNVVENERIMDRIAEWIEKG